MNFHSAFASLLICAILLVSARDAGAAPKFVDVWRNYWVYCTQLLHPGPPPGEDAIYTAVDLKARFNAQALKNGRATFVSTAISPIPHGRSRLRGAQTEWLDALLKKSIDWILDRNLPFWRNDGDWYFQTEKRIELYSPEGTKPIQFREGSFILMHGQLATGQIFLGKHPNLELFD